MKIELLAPPYSGHLHPLLAIARQLQAQHQVTVLSTPGAQPAIAASGLHGDVLLSAAHEAALWQIANPGVAVKANPLRMHAQLRQALQLMAQMRHALQQRWAEQRPDLVIVDFTLPPAGLLAAELGIRWWTSLPSPCVLDCADGPPPYLGGMSPPRTAWQRVQQAAGRQMIRLFKRGVHAWQRPAMRRLGVPAIYRRDGSEQVYSDECILALGVPELEFPRRWPAALQFIGPMLHTPHSEHAAPPFVDGARHLLVTAGTHQDWVKPRLAEAAAALARQYPHWQVHVSQGHQHDLSTRAQPLPNLHLLPFVDYARHLPRYDRVLHHGGAGVMYHALRAGIPALVYPLDYDQFDHAARLHAAGAGLWLRRLEDLPALFAQALQADAFPGLPALQASVQRHMAAQAVLDRVASLER
ncbi:nucleotide disphospho-sugar-binding domain-containing protein [Stenotrophomonas sp. SAU14A_NAIMI4_8]|uniref:glycosyltransferase n=1 Tax=Stenotrophomonas sp. SAU14A_NAIMI4_8 TaxID=2072409 RepID=UPI000D53D149|nr:nucleotide disphospho-sugar-binding domain-containing protein [Stenotrophomonas sp. SAU14A_NAIMI4_8]AWH32250.1 glycosyl transferase [Stenotrophomonas sp. SAU14A_NAIMI4_8]